MDSRLTFCLLLNLLSLVSCGIQIPSLGEIFFTQDQDYGARAPQLITSRGFGYEIHYFVSQDGFINAIHRILNPRILVKRSAILFFHGVTGSSNNFLNNDDSGHIDDADDFVGNNIAFELAKRGHDVWLLDQRATPFSSNHTIYSKFDKEYWNWALDEIALLDLPAAIDYVRRCTARHQIGYIGHSQGAQVMLMLLSRMQEYNNYIRPCILYAPTFYLGNSVFRTSVLLRLLPVKTTELVLKTVGGKLTNALLSDLIREVCRPTQNQEVCKFFGYVYLSFASYLIIPVLPNLNYKRLAVYVSGGGLYYTVSARLLGHNIQMVRSNVPAMIGYTPEINMKLYGTPDPPVYDPSLITCDSLVFFSAVSDTLTSPPDVQHLRDRLRVTPILDYTITDPTFGHAGFIFASREKIVPNIIIPVIRLLDTLY